MMTTAAQLVMATILNFLGMAPEAQEPNNGLQATVFAETREMIWPQAEEGKICQIFIFEDAGYH